MSKRRRSVSVKLVKPQPPEQLYISWSLVLGHGFTSRLIAWFGGGGYSHIDVITPTGDYRGAHADVIDEIPAGFQNRPAHYQSWKRQTIYTLAVTPAQYRLYWAFSDGQLGKPYDTRGLVKTFVFGRADDWRADDSWWCSEEVAANCEYAGIIRPLPLDVTHVEPGDCAFFLTGAGATWADVTNDD